MEGCRAKIKQNTTYKYILFWYINRLKPSGFYTYHQV